MDILFIATSFKLSGKSPWNELESNSDTRNLSF